MGNDRTARKDIEGGNGGTRSGVATLDDIEASGSFQNTGTILGNRDGVYRGDNVLGSVVNAGSIVGTIRAGIRIDDDIRTVGALGATFEF